MATPWQWAGNTANDWRKQPTGSTTRRDYLSNHIGEVSLKLADTYSVQGKSHNPSLEKYLSDLNQAFRDEFGTTPPADAPTGVSAPFIRGIARR